MKKSFLILALFLSFKAVSQTIPVNGSGGFSMDVFWIIDRTTGDTLLNVSPDRVKLTRPFLAGQYTIAALPDATTCPGCVAVVPDSSYKWYRSTGSIWTEFGEPGTGGGGGAVTSVSNSDGTVDVSPTTGDAVISLNQAHDFTFTGSNEFTKTISLDDTAFSMLNNAGTFKSTIINTSSLTADRVVNINWGNTTRNITFGGNFSTVGNFTVGGSGNFGFITTGATITVQATGTMADLATAQTFTNKTLTSPAINSDVDMNSINAGSIGDAVLVHRPDSLVGQVSSYNFLQQYYGKSTAVNGSPVVLITIPTSTDSAYSIEVDYRGADQSVDGTVWKRLQLIVVNSSGTVTIENETTDFFIDGGTPPTYTTTISVSSTNILVQITGDGLGATQRWIATAQVQPFQWN